MNCYELLRVRLFLFLLFFSGKKRKNYCGGCFRGIESVMAGKAWQEAGKAWEQKVSD